MTRTIPPPHPEKNKRVFPSYNDHVIHVFFVPPQYEPSLEDLRIRHYKDYLNAFLGLPLKMKGVSVLSERPGFFRPIADASPEGVARVYAAAEALFGRLEAELKNYQARRFPLQSGP